MWENMGSDGDKKIMAILFPFRERIVKLLI
jgi:hypothetical protein